MLKLKKGDKVAIVAPASYLSYAKHYLLENACEILQSWGLQVVTHYDLSQKHFYFAGDEQYRASQLLAVVKKPDIKAIFVTRGGYGCARLLPALGEFAAISPRLFCGFSDITALTLAFETCSSNLQFIHGPGLAVESFAGDSIDASVNRQRLHELMFHGEQGLERNLTVLNEGRATAPITGGCLSVVCSLLGTSFEPDFSGKILFLEDVDEKPYAIDRMLTQLKQADKLACIEGLVFGDMHGCSDYQNDLKDVVIDVLGEYNHPVLYGFEAGHGPINLAFAYGQLAEIDSSKKTFRLLPSSFD